MTKAATPERSAAHWLVAGRVQGVGFRWFVCQAAERLGVRGDVRNLRDGRVEIRVSGSTELVNALLDEVQRGPSGARVDGVEQLSPDLSIGFRDFGVRR